MTDTPPPDTPVADHFADIAAALEKLETEREAERAKKREEEATPYAGWIG